MTVSGGFVVETAYDGEAGLGKCLSFLPDVILLDIAMPGIHGWEFCRRLRADPRTKDIPVVIMTAWLSDSLKQQVEEAKAARVLLKPFDENELVDIVRSLAPTPVPVD